MQNRFRNKNGIDLSVYAFSCGYIQTKTTKQNNTITLYRDGALWNVQARNDSQGRYLWQSFEQLTDARRFYKLQK
jgi:hypothetical protein